MFEVVVDIGVRVGAAVTEIPVIMLLVKLTVRVLVVKIHSQIIIFSFKVGY